MIDNFIFQPNNKSEDCLHKQYFCLSSQADFIDSDGNYQQHNEDQNTLAKKIIKDSSIFYYIKSSTSNQLYNPFSKFDREKSYSFLDNVVRPSDKFLLVNNKVFNHYLKFIHTKNTAWLNLAERERA
jgi:hypothetical protein